MSVVLHTVSPQGVTRRRMADVEDIRGYLTLIVIALHGLNHPAYRRDKQLWEALLRMSCDALLDGWLEFAAQRARDEVAVLTALWAESYPWGQQPPAWPVEAGQPSEASASV